MLNKAFFKRIIPFFLTFALGLFVASFFVNIIPQFKFKRTSCFQRKEHRNLRFENERLRMENLRLQQRLENTERQMLLDNTVPPPAPIQPLEMPVDDAPQAR